MLPWHLAVDDLSIHVMHLARKPTFDPIVMWMRTPMARKACWVHAICPIRAGIASSDMAQSEKLLPVQLAMLVLACLVVVAMIA